MEGPPLGPGGEDITWPDQVAPRGRKASSTRKIKPQTSNLFLFFSLPVALVSCCSPFVLGCGPVPSGFCFCAPPVRCCAGVPASLLSVRCSLVLAGLAGVLCCCLLCLCVCCWAWLSSVVPCGSWWLLVSCLGGVLWFVPGCCAVPCCCSLCCLALRRCALCCFVLLCLVLPRAVLCRGHYLLSWGPVPSGAVFCYVPPRCVCFAVVCRCMVLFAVVLCAVSALGCRVVCFLLYLLEKPL